MAPSEETAAATCSQQQKQDVGGTKLQQDSPKIQQDASVKREEDVNQSTSHSCTDQLTDGLKNASDCGDSMNHSASSSCADSVTDGVTGATTDCAENVDSLFESQNSNEIICVKNCNPRVDGSKTGFNSCVGTTDSVVDSHKNADTACKENVDHILGNSQNVACTDQVEDDTGVSVTTVGSIYEAGDSPKSVVLANKINDDQILDGSKEVAANCAENTDQLVTSAKSVATTCLRSVINEGIVNMSVDSVVFDKEDKVVDNPECVACASMENTAEVRDRPENKAVVTNAVSHVENIACIVSVAKEQATNMNKDDASHVNVASKVVDMETANEGCGEWLGAADEDQGCDEDDSVREQCMFLLKELVSQADEVAQQRRGGAKKMEGGPLWCRLPVSKVSEALKFCRSSTSSALADNKQSSTKQYTTCDSHLSFADESDLIQDSAIERRVKEMGASSSVLPLYPSPPDSFAEESTPPPVFQGHKTMTVDPSLPSTPDDSSEDSPSREDAVLLFTPTCVEVPISPSVACLTPPSDTVLGPVCMPLSPQTPVSSSQSMKGNKHDPASSLLMVEQKPQHPSITTLPTPQRFLFQLEPAHLIKMSDGQKLFACDICSGVYQRSFSLKRHFLRTHINHRYLTERDISNCCIIVSERFAKDNLPGSFVEKKNVSMGTDIDVTQGSPDNVTKNSSSDKCSTVNSVVENDVIFPNLYCCHSCSVCFDTKDELKYHLCTYKHAAATSKEKTTTKPVSGSQKARSKSLPNLKKGSKVRDRSMSASSQELSSLMQVPSAHGQPICESASLSPGHVSKQITFSQMSSFVVLDQSVPTTPGPSSALVTSGLPKSTGSLSSRSLASVRSSKHLPSSHILKCEHPSEDSTPDCSLKHIPTNHSSNPYMSSNLLKPVSLEHLSKSSSSGHSSKSSLSGHSSQFSLNCQPTSPSSSHSLKQAQSVHSSNRTRHEFISSPIAKLTVPNQLSGPVISKQSATNIGHFAKPISSDKFFKSSERGQVLCMYCDKSFSTPTLHKRHVLRSHPHAQLSLQNKTPHHKCAYCIKPGGTFKELPLLVQHLLATHPDLYHVCTTCELRFDSKQALDHHQTIEHYGDHRWNSVCTAIPLPPLSQTLTSDVNIAGMASQSAPELGSGSKQQTSSEGSVDLLGSSGEFLYTCSVCRQVFNDYVAMCRHHRQVHKGKRSLNSVVQGVGSPALVLENRSQSPFVIPEKGSDDQVQVKKDLEGCVDEQGMMSDVLSTEPVNSDTCRMSDSENEKNTIKLPCQRHGLETNDFASETVEEIHQANDQNKTEPTDKISNVAKAKPEEDLDFTTFPSVDGGEGVVSSPRVPHSPTQLPLLSGNIHQVDVYSSCADKDVQHCLDVNNIVSCTADKIGTDTESSGFTVQVTECSDVVSACGGSSDFAQKSASNPQVFETLDAQNTSEHVLNNQKSNCVLESPLNCVFEDISDQSEDSADLSKPENSVFVEPGSKISLVDMADDVKTMSVNKCLDLNLVVGPKLGSECSATAKTPDCVVDCSEPPTAGTLWPFETCSESSLADNSTALRASPASTLDISDPLEACSNRLQVQTPVSVDETSEMCTDVISDSEDKSSLPKNKNSATEDKKIIAVVPEVSESVAESRQYSMEESVHDSVAETIDSMVKIPELSFAETTGHVVEDSESLPGETSESSTNCREISSNPPSNETQNFLEGCCDSVLKKVSDSMEDNMKSSLHKISDCVEPVICESQESVKPSLCVILNSVESVGESSLTETLEQPASVPLTECSNFTDEIANLPVDDNFDMVEGSDKQSSNYTEECDKTTLPDSVHSIEWPSKPSVVDTSDCMEEGSSELPLGEMAVDLKNDSHLLIEISDSMESCPEQKFSETIKTEESIMLSSDDVADGMESSSKPSLEETLNSTIENTGLEEVVSNKPHLAAESNEVSLTESIDSLEGNLKTELTETSHSLARNSQSPVIESLEKIIEPLLIETSVEQNYCTAVPNSLDSVTRDSKCASAETTYLVEEDTKSSSTEILDLVEENSKSVKEISDPLEENSKSALPESLGSVEFPESLDTVGEGSRGISMDSFDSLTENHRSEYTDSSSFLEECSKSLSGDNLDPVKEDVTLASAEVSDSLEENYKAALTKDCGSVRKNSENLAESPKFLLSPTVYSIETGSKLTSCTRETDFGVRPETSDDVQAKSKSALSATQGEGERVSSRTLRSNSAPLTKSLDPTEENDTIPLNQRLLQNKNETVISDQSAGSGRVLRKWSAVSVGKSVEVVVDSSDHSKGDSNRAIRRSTAHKNDDPSVAQEVSGDVESGLPKSRPKASAAVVRRTRLRKFSRRMKGDQVQEDQHLDPETLFYCQIAGNIQDNLLHHLDGKLEHEVTTKSQDLNKKCPSQPHMSLTTSHEEKHNHRHHHRTPWEKFNFPKKYDGRCREGTVCLASYIKDMSHLDISTQLTMQQNLQRLSAAPVISRSSVDVSAEISKDDVIGFSRGLCLSAKVCADRRRSLRSAANRGRDALLTAPGGAASTFTASASLKRWSSADDVAAAESVVELSGEWVRPRSYICAACGIMFNDLWDLEDHKYSQHPNVWCTHYEFEQADLDQAVDTSKSQCGGMSSKDFCRRFLLVREAMETVPYPTQSSEVKCTKCERGFSMLPELHRHILECGGDTTWMLLPSPTSSGRRTRKWRPFGSRRRRQQGSHRRGMKRNIPTTPVKQYFRARHRTVAGDSIQRMLANLPAKRSTRRVIQFSEDEIKTRSQGTIHSNRLLRKRYKVSFASGVMRTSHKTGQRVVQSLQGRTPTTDTNDAVYRKLTIRSPKKLPGTSSVALAVSSEQTSTPKQELPNKKLPQSKSQPVTSVPQSKSAGSDFQKRGPRMCKSLSPVATKSESVPLIGSEETKQPSVHKSRGRSKKPVSPQTCNGRNDPTEETGKENSGSGLNVQEFDMDINTVGNTEKSNILAAMRIAMLEGVITKMPTSGASFNKLTKKLSVKTHPCLEDNTAVLPGKRKKLELSEQNAVKKKTKLSQSELEERFLRNKGYTHPDEVTDEPIICKGCGLQFDSGSAELRHRKTCIYVPSQEDAGLSEVEDLHSCLLSYVQSPSGATVLKHSEQSKAAVSSNSGEHPACHKKTTAKAKCKNKDNSSSITTVGKQDIGGLKKSPGSNSENCTSIGRTKVKPRVTNTRKQITKRRDISDSQIVKGKAGSNLDSLKKGPTSAGNSSTSTTKQKVGSMEVVSSSPGETQRKQGTESTISCPSRKKKKFDVLENASNNPVGTKKKIYDKENTSSCSLGTKEKIESTENVKSGSGRTKKKIKDAKISRDETARTKTKSNSCSRIFLAKKKKVDSTENASVLMTEMKLDGTEDAISSSSGIVNSVISDFTGVKHKSRNSENCGSGLGVLSKKQVNTRRTVSSSPLGRRKKLGNTGKHSTVGKKRKFECTENVTVGSFEIQQQPAIMYSDTSNLILGREESDNSESDRAKGQVQCDGIVLVAETVDNSASKIKKRSVTANTVLTARKKEFGSNNIVKGGKKKPGSTENETHSPASSDTDDKMPELQKEEPIENLKTETPSPKVEDLCDIPILSPVGCEPLGEDCDEKKRGGILTKDKTDTVLAVEEMEGQPLPVGKKQSKGKVKNSSGLRQTGAIIKTKPSAIIKKKDIKLQTVQIPLHVEPSKEETSQSAQVEVTEPAGVFQQGEMDSDDKPLVECFGALITVSQQMKETLTSGVATITDKDETQKVVQEQGIEKSASLLKQQRRKPVRHRNSTPLCDRKDKKVAAKPTAQLTEEDSNDDLLPIAKLKEVIQKKILPLKELDSSTSAANDHGCLTESNMPVVIRLNEVLKSGSSVQHNTEGSPEILDHVSLAEKGPIMSRRAALKRGKRGRTHSWHQDTSSMSRQHQSQTCRKASLPVGLEISASERVPTVIHSKIEKSLIPKKMARKYSEQAESQDSTQMGSLRFHTSHEREEKGLCLKEQCVEGKRQVGTKKKAKQKYDKIQFENGECVNSPISKMPGTAMDLDNKTDSLASTKHETNISGLGKRKEDALLMCEETDLGMGKKLSIAGRKVKRLLKDSGSKVAMVDFPVGLMSDTAAPSVVKSKRTNQLVSEGHQAKMSGIDEESKGIQNQRTSCLIGKKFGITKRRTKTQLEELKSHCTDNANQTHSSRQMEGTDHLGAERIVGNEGMTFAVGKRQVISKRKSKQQTKESESNDGGAYSGVSQRPVSNTVIEKAKESDPTDVQVFVFEEGENERQVTEPTEETVLCSGAVTPVSICEKVKVRRRTQTNFTDMNRKAVHLIDNKYMGPKNKKKANVMAHKTRKTRQNIKLIIGKGRNVHPTDGEEQICRVIVGGEEKQTINTLKDEANIVCGQERETGDEMEMDKDSGKHKLNDVVVETENTSTSVPDTDSRMDLTCKTKSMNVLRCDEIKAAYTSLDETDDTTDDLSTEREDTSSYICFREETSDLIGGKKDTEKLNDEKEPRSQTDKEDRIGPAFDNEEGLSCQMDSMDSVGSVETKNVDNEKEYRATLTEDQEEIKDEVFNSDIVISKRETVPVRSEHADSLLYQENYLNPVIIQQGEMNGPVVQMGSSLLAISTVGSKNVEESQADKEGPLRQARRTRCNTSYEELYTWSDVTSETEEESSQELPDANIMAALCQNTDVSTYEEIAAMIANGDFFPSGSKKKKKKLRNNSRQYRNGHLRRKRHKKQKLRAKLVKKTKRSTVNEFIVTDIETGQEESQDSCESVLLAQDLKTEHPPVNTETHTKPTDMKDEKKRTKTSLQPESHEQASSNEKMQICDSSKPKQKRKSSVASVFFCALCNKHYSTNYNLMKHKLSLMHKRLSEKDQPSIPADVQNTEHKHLPPCSFQNTESEEPSPVEQIVETEMFNSHNTNIETESSRSFNHSQGIDQESSCLAPVVEMGQLCSSVQNTDIENSCSSTVQSVRDEHPCSSGDVNLNDDHQPVAENIDVGNSSMDSCENTVYERPCSVVQNVQGEEHCSTEPERTYTLMQNMEVEQFSTCTESTDLPEREADQSSTSVSKPATSRSNNGHISEPGSAVQNLTLDGVQQGIVADQTLPAVSAINETLRTVPNNDAGVFFEQSGVCIERQENNTSEWLEKERDIQQNMNAVNWSASGEEQKQAGWFEGQVDNNQWLYTGQWPQEMAWGKEVNSSMNWNAGTTQDDSSTFFQSNSASLGSILDSVNQILDNERSAHGLSTAGGCQPYMELLRSGTADVDPTGGLRELQQAMGATDEEMAMLQQLGEGSWPLEDADIMDLDNQKSDSVTPTVASASTTSTSTNTAASAVVKHVEGTTKERTKGEEDGNAVSSVAVAQAAVTTRAVSGRGGVRTQDIQLARYESKDMVCPVCSRRFLGLTALRAHLAAAHNSSTRHRTQAIKRPRIVPSSASDGTEELTRHVCLVCKELLPDEQGLADHVAVAHVERQNPGGRRPDGMGGSNHTASGGGGGGGGDEGLRSHMTSALGGLLTRALNNFLGKNRSQPSPPAAQVPSPSAGSSGDSRSSPLLAQPIARLLGRGLKMTNRRHSCGPVDELPFSCVDCDERFTSESNRNRHIARAHRGHHHRRLSTDSPLELTRMSSPITSSESTVSEVDTDSMPLSIRMSNFNSERRPGDSEPCISQLITASTGDSETSVVTKETSSSVKIVSNLKGESCSMARVQRTDHTAGMPGNHREEEEERSTVAIARSTDVGRMQDQGRLTQWRNSIKSEASQLRPESVCSVNDEDSIKAKAVAALRALNARDKRIRNGLSGTIGAALWSAASRKKSKGLNCDDRFRFPLVRKTPPSTNRFASLAEKKKKYISSTVKFEATGQSKGCPEEERQEIPTMPLNAAIPFSYDIYEFQDEVEQVQRPSELRLRAPVGKIGSQDSGADTGPSSDFEESRMAEWESLLRDSQPLSVQKGEKCCSVEQHTLENPKRKLLKSLKLSEQKSSHKTHLKHSHSNRNHESGKKKRWHRIIVDSGDDTSDTETVAEPHDTYRVALDQRLSNQREEGEKYINAEHKSDEGGGIKRRRVVPRVSGVLVEDRQCGKQAKTAKQPSKGSSRRSTKTDLLMSVFAKSRQRNSYINTAAAAAGHSVSAQPPFCNTSFSGSYRSVGTFGNVAEVESESDSGSLATSVSTGNLAVSSDDERMVKGRKSRKQKREKKKMAAL